MKRLSADDSDHSIVKVGNVRLPHYFDFGKVPNNLEVDRLPTAGIVFTTPPYDLMVSAPTISSGLYSEPFTKTSGFIFLIM